MEKFAAVLGASFLFCATIILAAPVGALFGAIAGWAVGLFFGDTVINVLGAMGLHGATMWQLGATLGFCGSFLRTQVSSK